jgi:hypothetical protein
MEKKLYEIYNKKCKIKNDINEHLPILKKYASECKTIVELGVRKIISSWALLVGLYESKEIDKRLYSVDIVYANGYHKLRKFYNLTKVKTRLYVDNSLTVILPQRDMTFIDTWHIYGQLKKELDYHSKLTNKYIIMHDTTSYEFTGEFSNLEKMVEESQFTKEEIKKGLWHAIDDFLKNNNNWILHERLTNNNGLTILKKINN